MNRIQTDNGSEPQAMHAYFSKSRVSSAGLKEYKTEKKRIKNK